MKPNSMQMLREIHGMSYSDLASITGIQETVIIKIENGIYPAKLREKWWISNAINCTPDDLQL